MGEGITMTIIMDMDTAEDMAEDLMVDIMRTEDRDHTAVQAVDIMVVTVDQTLDTMVDAVGQDTDIMAEDMEKDTVDAMDIAVIMEDMAGIRDGIDIDYNFMM